MAALARSTGAERWSANGRIVVVQHRSAPDHARVDAFTHRIEQQSTPSRGTRPSQRTSAVSPNCHATSYQQPRTSGAPMVRVHGLR